MTNMRQVALALLLLSGLLGLISRVGGWNELVLSEPTLDLRKIAAGQNIGPFLADGTERDRLSLRLPSPQCTGAIFLTASDIYHRPEKLIADSPILRENGEAFMYIEGKRPRRHPITRYRT